MNTATLEAPSVPAKATTGLYFIADYERNGYSDSDFMVVYWNDATGKIEQQEYGSTRYAGNPAGGAFFASLERNIPDSILAKIRDRIYDEALALFTINDTARVETPGSPELPFGTKVRFLTASTKRHAYQWAAGDTGEITWTGHMGTFYRKGYNKPNRENGRVGVRLADGRRVFAPMKAVRLDREIDPAQLAADAATAARNMRFEGCVPGYTWATKINPAIRAA